MVLSAGNAAVDVYGFGQLLYQVLTAEPLLQGAKRLPRCACQHSSAMSAIIIKITLSHAAPELAT